MGRAGVLCGVLAALFALPLHAQTLSIATGNPAGWVGARDTVNPNVGYDNTAPAIPVSGSVNNNQGR